MLSDAYASTGPPRLADTTAGTAAVAIGFGASATAADAIASGTAAGASGTQSIAIGKTSKAETANSIAIGNGADAKTGAESIAIGKGAQSQGGGSIALGSLTLADASGALATGSGPGGGDAVWAHGNGSRAHGAPVGASVYAGAEGSDAMGRNVYALQPYSSAYGDGAQVNNRGEDGRSPVSDSTSDRGRHQEGTARFVGKTTTNALTILCSDDFAGAGAGWTPQDNRAFCCIYKIVGMNIATGDCAAWQGMFMISELTGVIIAGSIKGRSVIGTAVVNNIPMAPDFQNGGTSATWTARFTKSTGLFLAKISGVNAETIRWTCSVDYVQAGEGT